MNLENINNLKNRLERIIVEKAFLKGEFRLSSGEISDHYFDCKMVTLDSEGLSTLSEILISYMKEDDVQAIGGLSIGADPIVAGVLSHNVESNFPVRGFLIRKERKEHGTKKRIEGPQIEPGTKVAIVDDVITSGNSIITAIDAAREEGLNPVVAYALVDREEGGAEKIREKNVPFKPLFLFSKLNKK
jgi:orotate phosphoribosyltransferase